MKNKRTWLAGGAGLLAALLFGAWWVGLIGPTDPAVAALQRDFDAAIASGEPIPREQMRARVEQLTEAQRRQFFMQNRGKMMAMMTERMTATLNLPPEELRAWVNERADRAIALRQQPRDESQRRGPGGRGGGEGRGGPPGGRGDRGSMSQSERMKRILGFTSPAMRGAFTETKRLIDDELEARGQEPLEMREMRQVMRDRG